MNLKESRNHIVDTFIKELKSHNGEWQQPYFDHFLRPINPTTKIKYTGINRLRLVVYSYDRNYKDNRFLTFPQIKKNGYKLKKGSKGILLEKWAVSGKKDLTKIDDVGYKEILPKQINPNEKRLFLQNTYYVFNGDDIENLKPLENKHIDSNKRIDFIENLVKKLNVKVIIKNNIVSPYYSPSEDSIYISDKKTFRSIDSYYSTLLHELIHSTGHKNRLNRLKPSKFADEDYTKEEIITELATLEICKKLSYTFEDIKDICNNSKSYIKGWLENLENDYNIFFETFKEVEKIEDFLKIN